MYISFNILVQAEKNLYRTQRVEENFQSNIFIGSDNLEEKKVNNCERISLRIKTSFK